MEYLIKPKVSKQTFCHWILFENDYAQKYT